MRASVPQATVAAGSKGHDNGIFFSGQRGRSQPPGDTDPMRENHGWLMILKPGPGPSKRLRSTCRATAFASKWRRPRADLRRLRTAASRMVYAIRNPNK